jgi:co-chaperonin GroES (HSP10)
MTNIKPLGQLVLIKKIEESEKTTASGLVLTAASLDNELSRGTIIAVGDGTRDIYGNMHPILLEIADTVYFNDSHLTEITDDQNEKYYFISSNNIYGKIANA